jgi:hypothetical protein
MMRRLIFLICAVVLLFDLADDGRLGKVKFVAPNHAAQFSASSAHSTSGQVDSQAGLPPAGLLGSPPPFTSQSASFGFVRCLTTNNFHFFGSAGGLPL